MASSGSLKSGMMRGGTLRNVSVRGFENLATGDSTLFRPDSQVPDRGGDDPDSGDEALRELAFAATRRLQSGNSQAAGVRFGAKPVRTGRGPAKGLFADAPGADEAARAEGAPARGAESLGAEDAARGAAVAPREAPPTPQSVLAKPSGSSTASETSSERGERQSLDAGSAAPHRGAAAKDPADARGPRAAEASASARDDPSRDASLPAPALRASAASRLLPADASGVSTPRVADPSAPSYDASEFVKLEDHDRSMAMASLALTVKNIALDAMVTETDVLRKEVEMLSPKKAKRSFFFGGSSEERRDDDASARAAGGGSGSDGDASGSDDFGPSSDEEGESLAGARSGADASAPKRKGSTRTVRTTTTRTILRRDGSAVETSESRESREGGEGGGAGAAAGASGPSAGSSSVDGVDNLAELEALRAEIKRLELELEKERQACFTLRAERVAWRAERSDMLEERDRLMEGAASTAKIFDGGDPESAAHESLAALVFALRGEDLAFDAVKIAKRADDVARSGAVAAVLGAMATHRDSERVQAAGAEALRAMAERSDHARTQLLKEPEEMLGRGGGVPALVGAMRANPDSAEVASAAGRALIAVAREKGEEGRRAIENARGREAIVAAAKKHPGEMSYADQAEELCAWLVAAF